MAKTKAKLRTGAKGQKANVVKGIQKPASNASSASSSSAWSNKPTTSQATGRTLSREERILNSIRDGNVVPQKPPKFSWVVPGLLAAHGRPTQPGHIQFLEDNHINMLITLTENRPSVLQYYPGDNLSWVHIPVKDECPPTQSQVAEFISKVQQSEKEAKMVSVHCAWGRGRTGVMLACYFITSLGLSAADAMAKVRQMRPGSIDTPQQEQVVQDHYALSANVFGLTANHFDATGANMSGASENNATDHLTDLNNDEAFDSDEDEIVNSGLSDPW